MNPSACRIIIDSITGSPAVAEKADRTALSGISRTEC